MLQVTFEKADHSDKTLEVFGKVRQVDGTQAEVKRFEVTAYSFSLSAFRNCGAMSSWGAFCSGRVIFNWKRLILFNHIQSPQLN